MWAEYNRESLFSVSLTVKSLTPLTAASLLRPEKQSMATDEKTKVAVQSLAFLAYKEKFLAGGWRYLTYFGRDTLISLRLLLPILSNDAIEAGLSAVFERISTNGQVCHEETIGNFLLVRLFTSINIIFLGDYAALTRKNNKETGSAPVYDYKMIDPNYELLPLLSAYFLDDPIGKGRDQQFLAKRTSSGVLYSDLLDKNVNLVLSAAKKFSDVPLYTNLVRFKSGQSVGNWRDSDQGNGNGIYPYDVNIALVPSSLSAIQRLATANILKGATYAANSAIYRQNWESLAPAYYNVIVTPDTAQKSINDYLARLDLPKTLLSSNAQLPLNVSPINIQDSLRYTQIFSCMHCLCKAICCP